MKKISKIRLSKCSVSSADTIAVTNALKNEYLGHGSFVVDFENKIKSYLGGNVSVSCVNSGTAALHLALESLELPKNSEVLVPSITYIATFQAISAAGLIPVSCEVSEKTLFLDPKDVLKKITVKTKCILPVHHSSSNKGIVEILEIAKKHKLRVVEDCAQSFGSKCYYSDEKVGTNPYDICCFSFDGIKNITSAEGGCVVSKRKATISYINDARFLGVEKDTIARNQGKRSWNYDVNIQGYRYHMSNINAALGFSQLKRIDLFKSKRNSLVEGYKLYLSSCNEITFFDLDYKNIMPHIFAIKVEKRNSLREYLSKENIETGIHYLPNHRLTKYKSSFSLPKSDLIYSKIITLPLHVDLTLKDVQRVSESIIQFYNLC